MHKMNKRGDAGEQVMFFSFLFLLLVVAVGITVGVYLFYGDEYEFRNIESSMLNYKVRNCMLDNFKSGIDNFKANFFSLCGINENAVNETNIMIKICESGKDCLISKDFIIQKGSNFNACAFEGAKENDAYPKCVSKEIEIDGKKYTVITGSNQHKRRILA